MRIAMCTETYLPYVNGVVTHINLLKQVLESLGHEVLIVTVSNEKKLQLTDGVLRCPSFRVERLYGYRATYPFSRARLQALAAFKPDIIHIHNEYTLGLFGIYAARKLEVPLVYSIHMDFAAYIGKFPGALTLFRRPLLRYLGHYVKHADLLVSMSPKAQTYVDSTPHRKQVHLLPNAVEVRRFADDPDWRSKRAATRAELGLADGTAAFVFIGRIAPEKSIDELIRQYSRLNLPPDRAQLFIVGGGPSLDKLREGVAAAGQAEQIRFLGHVANDKLDELLFGMDYYMSASTSEMHSMSMLEAMAAGLFCLIRHDAQNDWQVEPDVNGMIWHDTADLAAGVSRLLDESADAKAGRRERVLAWSRDNDELTQTKRLLQHYERVIRSCRPAAQA